MTAPSPFGAEPSIAASVVAPGLARPARTQGSRGRLDHAVVLDSAVPPRASIGHDSTTTAAGLTATSRREARVLGINGSRIERGWPRIDHRQELAHRVRFQDRRRPRPRSGARGSASRHAGRQTIPIAPRSHPPSATGRRRPRRWRRKHRADRHHSLEGASGNAFLYVSALRVNRGCRKTMASTATRGSRFSAL